jgi:hypothetical protein
MMYDKTKFFNVAVEIIVVLAVLSLLLVAMLI